VRRLGLGCAPLGNLYAPVTDDDAVATVAAALHGGITTFDTAPLYGHGLSEERLGLALRELGADRAALTISTKVGRLLTPGVDTSSIFVDTAPKKPVFDFSADGVRRSLSESLDRLGLDRVDVALLHDPDDHAEDALAGAFPALLRLRDEGAVDAIGAGMNQAALLERFVREVDLDCVLLAGRWTLLDQSGLGLLDLCRQRGVNVLVGGVFNSGLLADPDAAGATFDYAPAPAPLVARARAMREVCARHGVSLAAAALHFAASHPAVATVVVGARSPAEVTANIAAAASPVPVELWEELGHPVPA
jgi:D-threo-aldose 1-dehydrogenase